MIAEPPAPELMHVNRECGRVAEWVGAEDLPHYALGWDQIMGMRSLDPGDAGMVRLLGRVADVMGYYQEHKP